MNENKKEQTPILENPVFAIPKKSETDTNKAILEILKTVPWFDDVFKKDKEITKFAPAVAEFMNTHGWTSLHIYDRWTEWVILQIWSNETAGWFFIKCSLSGHDIKKEIVNHKAFYAVFLEEDQRLKNVELPHIIDDLSEKFNILIMDKLPGKSIWRLLVEHFFSPVFYGNKYAEKSDSDINSMIERLSEKIESNQWNPSEYINPWYIRDLWKEYTTHIKNKNALYRKKNVFFTYRLMEDAKLWDIEREDDVDAIDVLLNGNGRDVISGIKEFQKVYKEHAMSHNDLHSGNVMVVPKSDGSYKAGIIDFGKVSLPEKKKT